MRWTRQQRLVLCQQGVTLIGTDARGRPVVEQYRRWSAAGAIARWAVLQDGDPADVTDPVTLEPPGQDPLGDLPPAGITAEQRAAADRVAQSDRNGTRTDPEDLALLQPLTDDQLAAVGLLL